MLSSYTEGKNISQEIANMMGLHERYGAIQFPVYNQDGKLLYNKYRKWSEGGIMMMPPRKKIALYGANLITDKTENIVIVEGESDMLAFNSYLLAKDLLGKYVAVTSTNGVMSFKYDWFDDRYNYFCVFDNDVPGHTGMKRIWQMRESVKFAFIRGVNDLSELCADYKQVTALTRNFKRLESGFISHLGIEFAQPPEPTQYKRPFVLSYDLDKRKEEAKAIPFESLYEFNRQGKGICPFHNDTRPSLSLWRGKNLVTCFVCGITLDTIGFIMKKDKKTFYQALDTLVPPPQVQLKKKLS